jgi:hypothetical protein
VIARRLAIGGLVLAVAAAVLAVRSLGAGITTIQWSDIERSHAKTTEALVAVTEMAWGVAQCAERSGEVPPTSSPVPASVGRIAGQMYQSRFSDWSDPAFTCAGFHMRRPQRFQYRWTRADDGLGGVASAEADFDGDATIDHRVRLHVRCARTEPGLRCSVDPMPTPPFVPAPGPSWWP